MIDSELFNCPDLWNKSCEVKLAWVYLIVYADDDGRVDTTENHLCQSVTGRISGPKVELLRQALGYFHDRMMVKCALGLPNNHKNEPVLGDGDGRISLQITNWKEIRTGTYAIPLLSDRRRR